MILAGRTEAYENGMIRFAPDLVENRSASNPLRVACVVSGGNPDPSQMAGLF